MVKVIDKKEVNFYLKDRGYYRADTTKEIGRSLGVEYVRPKPAFSSASVELKRINAVMFGG